MIKKNILLILLLISCSVISLIAQEKKQSETDSIIMRALRDELYRNLNKLVDKEAGKPFFISYSYLNGEITEASAKLGTLFSSDKYNTSDWGLRLMMGDYNINDENFQDNFSNDQENFARIRKEPPIEPDYRGIRNIFWWNSDIVFRSAAKNYKSKLAALKDKPITSEDKQLPDYTKADPVKIIRQGTASNVSKEDLELLAKDISGVFKEYKDVYSSMATVYCFNSIVYIINTEGSEVRIPLNIALVRVEASVYSEKGEILKNSLSFTAPDLKDIPNSDTIKNAARSLANYLIDLKKAKIIEEAYTGPVIFNNDGVADIFSSCLFGYEKALIAEREPLVNSISKSMTPKTNYTRESKLDKRIISKDITVKAVPHMKEYNGIPLMGSFEVDAECIVPPDEIILINKGVLKGMICDRIPTKNFKKSNGHNRFRLAYGGLSYSEGPGVILVESENKKSIDELRQQIIEIAKDKGLDYVILVKPLLGGKCIGPLCFYKLDITTNKEELIRSMSFSKGNLKTLNKIEGCGNGVFVQNVVFNGTNLYNRTGKNGFASSFIVPDALLIEEMELTPDIPYSDTDLPIFENPVGETQE